MPRTCFVIGPIGPVGSEVRAAADDFMKYIVMPCSALTEFDYAEPTRADKLGEPGRITTQIIKMLMEADLVIADLTGNNANVFYELSLRHALGKAAVHMATEGTVLPFDVHDNRTIFYTMHSRRAEAAREELTQQIRRIHDKDYRISNPITETIGIIELSQSKNPTERALSLIAREVETLSSQVRQLTRATPNMLLTPYFQPGLVDVSNALSLYSKMPANAIYSGAAGNLYSDENLLTSRPIEERGAEQPRRHAPVAKQDDSKKK